MENGVMMQVFQWESPADGQFYNQLAKIAPNLSRLGVTAVWMPPAAKGVSDQDVGYGSYDYWDLGEFDQKGTIRTKYGTKKELEACIHALHEAGIHVYADMVFNHKGGADATETFRAVMVDQNDRTKDVGEPQEIEGWTKFTFPGRGGEYSDFQWHYYHFTGIDFDQKTGTSAIYRILGENKYWSAGTDSEKGNFDYLMNADIDHAHPEVVEELKRVAHFMIDEMKYDGFRYDALKHIDQHFIDMLSNEILEKKPEFYFVGEYWKDNESIMNHYLDETDYNVSLFDVPLHFNLEQASKDESFDLRTIFDGTLVQTHPTKAVTFVDNHDSQPGQSLESWVEPWFKEIAYALILLRKDGYPCLFAADYDGIERIGYEGIRKQISLITLLRKHFAYGEQDEYFVSPTKIAWVRRGTDEHPHPLAVLISTGDMDHERLFVGEQEAGRVYKDWSGKNEEIVIGDDGFGDFTVGPGSVTYWTWKDAKIDDEEN
ncbi:MAG: alpha-amylase [Peptoniphilaceae bacterium]|nr:alpha-amylase [Peptoniphilaceae bacterium]MDY5765775.1 alpha-amylase [Peptoniphilaceae bacterium]